MNKKRKSKVKNILISIISLIIGFVFGFIGDIYLSLPDSYMIPETVQGSKYQYNPSTNVAEGAINSEVIKSNKISFHFIELGNKYTGDCIYIKCGNTDILVDGGSRASSVPYIYEYVDSYMEDDCLDYVIVTHAHQDHYAGYATDKNTESLFDHYRLDGKSTGVIIDFPLTNQKDASTTYTNYRNERRDAIASGAKHFTAFQCFDNDNDKEEKVLNEKEANRFYKIGEDENESDIILQILYTKFYEHSSNDENNYSVCFQIIQGQYKYLFTGDLEAEGEESLVENKDINNLSKVALYKAGHHGSKTSSTEELLEIIEPMNVVVCCCAGSSEYTSNLNNQFPTQAFIDRVSIYTDRIYVTTLCLDYKLNQFESFNGTIVVYATGLQLNISASNNTTKLKDTQWFKDNRTLPNGAVST